MIYMYLPKQNLKKNLLSVFIYIFYGQLEGWMGNKLSIRSPSKILDTIFLDITCHLVKKKFKYLSSRIGIFSHIFT